MSKQLEEAEAIINKITVGDMQLQEIAQYKAKYHPKDELFEKWDVLFDNAPIPDDHVSLLFNKAKELGLFTMAMDEVFEKFQANGVASYNAKRLKIFKEIRNKYSAEEE